VQSGHLRVTPKFDLGEEDIQVIGIVTTLRVVPKCWEAMAIGLMGLAETLVPCCNIVLVRIGRGIIHSEWANATSSYSGSRKLWTLNLFVDAISVLHRRTR
jgi:hypothetical protein